MIEYGNGMYRATVSETVNMLSKVYISLDEFAAAIYEKRRLNHPMLG